MTREELLSIPRKARDIADEQDRIEELKSKLYSPRGLDTNEKVQSSGSQTALADVVMDMEQKLEARKEELRKLRADALKAINEADLDSNERLVLMLRYTEGCAWSEITETIHYSVASVFRIHRAALDELFEGAEDGRRTDRR